MQSASRWPASATVAASLLGGVLTLLIGVFIAEVREGGENDAKHTRRLDDHDTRITELEETAGRMGLLRLYSAPGRRTY